MWHYKESCVDAMKTVLQCSNLLLDSDLRSDLVLPGKNWYFKQKAFKRETSVYLTVLHLV